MRAETDERAAPPAAPYPLAGVRAQFPILSTTVHGKPLIYLDSAATSQKPRSVIQAEVGYYERENANIHRGVHWLSERATVLYDEAREKGRAFLGAGHAHEVIFTRGTTDGINLVASSFGQAFVRANDEIIVSALEHHSNIVPWQMLCERTGAKLRVLPMADDGTLVVDALPGLLSERTRLVAVSHVSNALGTVNPVRRIVEMAHAAGAAVLVDGAQAAPHLPLDVAALGCDFFVCSAHKMYGPTGIGLLYGRESWLDRMPPYQGGGDMIASVSFAGTTYAPLPQKFEAGTPHIAGVVGLGAAIDWMNATGIASIGAHEHALLAYATERVAAVDGVHLVGTAAERAGVLSFVMEGVHPHDIGTILDSEGIAIRAGHHCAQPVMDRLGIPATARASFAAYSAPDDVDALVSALHTVRRLFA